MNNNAKMGIVAFITMLLGFGGGQLLPEQHDAYYVCELTKEIGVFDRFSASMKTGYVGDTRFQCRDGNTWSEWKPLSAYAAENGLELADLFQKVSKNKKTKEIVCYRPPRGCEPK